MLCIEAEATAPPQATQITKVEDSDEDEVEEDEEAKEVEAQRSSQELTLVDLLRPQ
jgi:hypothetical protein